METTKTQITDFLEKCEEVKNCKFIMATTKIKDLLKSIVNSAELYELFNTVAANFDYVAAKQKCFVEADGTYGGSKVVLPDTVGDRLAFIFCLLVEFDRNDINFNAFLQKYYPKDGSYYASYHLFCDEVIGSLEMIVCDIFQRELQEPQQSLPAPETAAQLPPAMPEPSAQNAPDPDAAAFINTICMLIESEREGLESSTLSKDDKEAARAMLTSLAKAVREGDKALIKSLTCGYNYFVMQTLFVSGSLGALFEAVGNYLVTL
ncbi:MAG: hypothetical protein NC131_00780 [Roseburia sp.]|nr:hypothetical protein [Roseburia sp.]